jgi:hypothetical protein
MAKLIRKAKQESSFSEEKEAKRLLSAYDALAGCALRKWMKVFWFFFSKKNILPCFCFRPFNPMVQNIPLGGQPCAAANC